MLAIYEGSLGCSGSAEFKAIIDKEVVLRFTLNDFGGDVTILETEDDGLVRGNI